MSSDDLWSTICATADRRQRPTRTARATPTTPENERAIERALLEALCGGMTQWKDDAQICIIHHWHCQSCNATGQFPNIEPGRLVRRHNRQGTTWTCHAPEATGWLPIEHQHHHHPVAWCPHCLPETDINQGRLDLPQLPRMSRGSGHHLIAMRMIPHV